MNVSDQIQRIREVLIGRGVDASTVNAMVRDMRADRCTDDQVLSGLVGALYDGLTYGNWPKRKP